jgi:hypothetical protein
VHQIFPQLLGVAETSDHDDSLLGNGSIPIYIAIVAQTEGSINYEKLFANIVIRLAVVWKKCYAWFKPAHLYYFGIFPYGAKHLYYFGIFPYGAN